MNTNIVVIFILTCLLILLIIIGTLIYMRNNNYSGEDEYQNTRLKNMAKMHIFTTIYINDDINILEYIFNMEKTVNTVIESHFHNIENSKKLILDNYRIEEEDPIESSIDNLNLLWIEINSKNPPVLLIKYNIEKRRITTLKDHRFFGGLFFLKMGGAFTNTKPITIYKEQYTPILSELLILNFGIFWSKKYFESNSKILISPSNTIKRINFVLSYTNIKVPESKIKIRKQTLVMIEILSLLSKSLNTVDKSLKLLIPVAFESSYKNYNNVGGIFVNYDSKDTHQSFQKKLLSNKYQAVATNNLQHILPKGKQARQSTDIVFTLGFLKSDDDSNIISNSITSYLSVGHYPIYIVSITLNKITYTTITIMTDQIDINKMKESIGANPNISKSVMDF